MLAYKLIERFFLTDIVRTSIFRYLANYRNYAMRELIEIAAALSDENRVRALGVLAQGELCGCQLIELLQLAPSTVSKHMSILRQAGLVEARKDGRWMYYTLPGPRSESPAVAKEAVKWAMRSLGDGQQVCADRRRIADIKCENPEVLCKRQMNRDAACCTATPSAASIAKGRPRTARRTPAQSVIAVRGR
jgi:DNA-binding transcriptional ArsR family regulator